tara:strand:+ start:6666 stop:7526 length:861 start_codon:yes stop_codon:yes gene_type:complete
MDFLFSSIESFIVEYSDGYLTPFTQGGFSKVYKYDNKIYIVQPYNEAVEVIYDKLQLLRDQNHILLPTDTSFVLKDKNDNDEELVLEFEPCSGDLFLDKMDKGSEVALNSIRDHLSEYDEQFQKMEALVKSIHKLGIHTMDIKPSNMLFCENNIIKMTDFGGSKYYDGQRWKGKGAGTQGYVAGNWDGTELDDYQEDLFALYLSFVEIIEPKPLESKAYQYRKGIDRVKNMSKQTTNVFSLKWLQKMKEIINYKVKTNIRNPKKRRNSRRISISDLKKLNRSLLKF